MTRRYAIALSFPGEHRDFVLGVAKTLARELGRERIFFHEWHLPAFVGKSGDLRLQRIYETESDFVVPFFSRHYAKMWCQLEWDAIRAMLSARRSDNAVVPVHLDDTQIPGWTRLDIGIRAGSRSPREIGKALLDVYRSRRPAVELAAAAERHRLVVTHVLTPDDESFAMAMKLYGTRIRDGVSRGDIARWVRDDPHHNVLLVATMDAEVVGFVLFHLLGGASVPSVFLAYLVVRRKSSPHVSDELLDELFRHIERDPTVKDGQILFEVDRPVATRRDDGDRTQRTLEPISRISVFDERAVCRGLLLRAFDIDYVQPSLDCQPAKERPMLLMSLRKGTHTLGSVSARDVRALLAFIYTEIYPSEFSDDEGEQRDFEEYCRELFERKTRSIPDPVSTLTFKQLRKLADPLDG